MATTPFSNSGTPFDHSGTTFDGVSDASITSPAASATAVAQTPSAVAATTAVTAVAAHATATAIAPTQIVSNADPVAAPAAPAAAFAPNPTIFEESNGTVAAAAAGATATALAPSSVTAATVITAPASSAAAAGLTPSVSTDTSVTIVANTPAIASATAAVGGVVFSASITSGAASASAQARYGFFAAYDDPGSTFKQPWTAILLNPDGLEFALNPIADVTINETFERVTATIEVPWNASGLPMITDLVSDIVLKRGTVKMYRLRVMDSEDVLSRESHLVRLTCCSYEEILRAGRIIYESDELSGDQLLLAWNIVNGAQARQDLGITRYVTPAGTSQSVEVLAGTTVAETLDSIAAADDGFDWWIDADLKFHTQEPRRESLIDYEWTWGAEIAEMVRMAAAEQYASAVYVSGATSTVTIPGGSTYPPPAPAIREIADMPYGRWERSFAYTNIVTNASLVRRADWHLGVGSRLRPTYTIVLEQDVWSPSIKLGGVVVIRAQSNERLNFKVPARIEEMTIQVTSDGGEVVSMMLRAESEEVQLGTGVPAEVTATNTPPAGSTVVAVPEPTGLSKTMQRISPVDGLATVISSIAERVSRQERT